MSVEVDPMDWLLLVEYHQVDAFVVLVEAWAVAGAPGRPPDARELVLEVLDERQARRRAA